MQAQNNIITDEEKSYTSLSHKIGMPQTPVYRSVFYMRLGPFFTFLDTGHIILILYKLIQRHFSNLILLKLLCLELKGSLNRTYLLIIPGKATLPSSSE